MKTTQRRPSPRLVRTAGVLWLAVVGVESARLWRGEALALFGIDARVAVLSTICLLVGVALLDGFWIRRRSAPELRRILPRNFSLESWSDVGLEIRFTGPIGRDAVLVDGVPQPSEVEGLPVSISGAPGRTLRVGYALRPLARGDVLFERPTLRALSPLGLWRFTAQIGEAEPARVFPNFAATVRFDALLMEARTREVGIKRRQRRGEGLEFHQLREYRAGDTLRQIDWKATARKRELISREYEEERDQRIVFLLDGSRRMRAKDGPLSHFDHSLNAMILLAHVALKGGDAVGLLSIGEERRWLPPAKGDASVHRLLRTVYDLEPTTLGIDFRSAAEELCRRQRRRSMIVVLTQLRREDLEDLLPAIRLMRRTHYVLIVNLRQAELDGLLEEDPRDLPEAFSAIGVWNHLLERRELHDRLRADGIQPLDVTPDQLGPAIVSRYYEIKQGGAL